MYNTVLLFKRKSLLGSNNRNFYKETQKFGSMQRAVARAPDTTPLRYWNDPGNVATLPAVMEHIMNEGLGYQTTSFVSSTYLAVGPQEWRGVRPFLIIHGLPLPDFLKLDVRGNNGYLSDSLSVLRTFPAYSSVLDSDTFSEKRPGDDVSPTEPCFFQFDSYFSLNYRARNYSKEISELVHDPVFLAIAGGSQRAWKYVTQRTQSNPSTEASKVRFYYSLNLGQVENALASEEAGITVLGVGSGNGQVVEVLERNSVVQRVSV
jgi:hypothetical protein